MLLMGMAAPDLADLALRAGMQAVILDGEHGFPLGSEVRAMVVAARAAGGRCFVRVPPSGVHHLGALSDVGVDGVLLSAVRDVDEVARAARLLSFPGAGTRSVNPFVPAAGIPGDLAHLDRSARTLGLWAMAETAGLLDQFARAERGGGLADRPAAWTGIVVGPYDLAADLGCEPDPGDRTLRDAVATFAAGAAAAGLRLGLFVRDVAALARWVAAGVVPQVVVVGYDRDMWFQECLARVDHVHRMQGDPDGN
jgi:2-keto-3-deoxy-L-rhamnonate aldolase RhmA